MRKSLAALSLCVGMVLLPGCGYEYDEPNVTPSTTATHTSDPEHVLQRSKGTVSSFKTGNAMPVTGPCSYAAAIESHTDIEYTQPTVMFGGIGTPVPVMHVERGVLVSWPEAVFLKLKAETPEAQGTSASMIEVTPRSFDSMVQRSYGLNSLMFQLGGLMRGPFYVTSYECLPLNTYD